MPSMPRTTATRSTGCWPIRSCKPRFTRPAARRASSAARPIGIASCLRLRKTGDFPKRGQIKKVHVSDEELDAYSFAAEIAWRLTSDKFGGPSLDEIFCDPAKAAYFDRAAKRFAPGFEPAQYRWAALRLRKASRELVERSEAVPLRVRQARLQPLPNVARLQADAACRPAGHLPAARRQTRRRSTSAARSTWAAGLTQHAECPAISDEVAHVSVITGDDLPGEEYLDAFKEDLVRRHAPKLEREPRRAGADVTLGRVGYVIDRRASSDQQLTAPRTAATRSSYARISPLAMS